jgi:hypothetical protein
MTEQDFYKLKYPLGEFNKPDSIASYQIEEWIASIEALPMSIDSFTKNLSEAQLHYKYRPEGWTIKQVVHHCADSHINSMLRFKLALTEDTPSIRPYFEDRFAKLIDYDEPIDASISILIGVHKKIGVLLKNLTPDDLKREFIHPEHGKHFSLEETIGVYAWHSNHHLAHIKQALNFKEKYT